MSKKDYADILISVLNLAIRDAENEIETAHRNGFIAGLEFARSKIERSLFLTEEDK